jgi:adenylate cyclase
VPETDVSDRQLLPSEKPLAIQRRRLEQAGYTEADNIAELGMEDLSMLCRFIYQTPVLPTMDPVRFLDTTGHS